jgi:hypothetical protein
MQRIFYVLVLLFLVLPTHAVATRDICGNPPPDQFREENNESIKGDLTGKANFLSSYVGKAELGGKIESTRRELFAKYSDANMAYMDRFLLYMFCYAIFDPKNPLTSTEKIKAIQEYKRQQSIKPESRSETRTEPPPINITGIWRDANYPSNGSSITQEGNLFQFKSWGVLPTGVPFESTGSGTVTGQGITSTYTARYQNGWMSHGNCSGVVSRDGSWVRITSTCTDNVLGTFVTSGVRQ